MLNRRDKGNGAGESGERTQPAAFRENPEVNAAIDKYIADNPKHWDYIKSLPTERMARMLVLSAVKQQKQQARLQDAIIKKLDENPEVKAALTQIVNKLPEAEREQALARLGGQTLRALKPQSARQGVRM